MPAFGENLGCDHASVFYKDSPKGYVMDVPAPAGFHDLKIQGAGAGTLTITTAPSDAQNVSYSINMRGTDQPLLDLVKMELTESETGSKLAMMTPTISKADRESGTKCIRFDVTVAVPPSLKELHIISYSHLQVKFDESVHLDLKRLSVVTMSPDKGSLILPTANFHASKLFLETYNGWIVGDVSLEESAVLDTQRGDGVAHVKVIQSNEHDTDKKASLQTATGSGRSEFTYIANKGSKRTIDSRHISARNGDVYLKYGGANFNGKIAMSSRSSTIHGVVTNLKRFGEKRLGRRDDDSEWTHARGDADGADRLRVESNGWTGLWF
ncbi:hypothetical protein NMY22_g4750 [Coprinellus aureogranulatus]|nr:hypothetical protein NMY22_g4750 [Coprinellus aureogranulatus]